MKTIRFILFAMFLGMFCSQAVAKDKLVEYNYELTRSGVRGVKSYDPNYVVFMVYTYGKKKSTVTNICLRNAVHGILFKGLAPEEDLGKVDPVMGSTTYEEHKEYFDGFFQKDFMQFVQETNKGMQDVMKIGKELKVGVKVKVNITLLKERLRTDGVLKNYKEMMM